MKTLNYSNLNNADTSAAQTLIDYYEGDQTKHLTALMDSQRKNWKQRNFIPYTRNITKTIVEKSGLLFNAPPKLEIFNGAGTKPVIDSTFNQLMDNSDWLEFFQNVDVYTRLLKSIVVLQQRYVAQPTLTTGGLYAPNFQQGDALLLTLLTRANSDVVLDITGTIILELAFLTSDITNGNEFTYRDITADEISDWHVVGDKETLIKTQPNIDGFVPATFVYDVNKPRKGAWVKPPEDIIDLQDQVNLAITDTAVAMAHQKQKTLYTNAVMSGASSSNPNAPNFGAPFAEEGFTPAGTSYGSNTMNASAMGGLGNVVTVQTGDPTVAPFVKFDGPVSDLDKLTDVMDQLIKSVAEDWCVNMRNDKNARANSGFQIIVEDRDNLQLRDRRAQSMQAAFRRFYNVCQRLYPTLTAGMLKVNFAPPTLPVDTAEQETMWAAKIADGRASILDYFRTVEGLDDQSAWEKIYEIQDVNQKLGITTTLTAATQALSPPPAPAGNSNAGSNPTGNV